MTAPLRGGFLPPTDAVERALAQQTALAVQTNTDAGNVVPQIRTAVVTAGATGNPPTCTVTWDAGTTNVAGIRYMWPYVPVVNDVVYTIGLDGVQWIVGKIYVSADYEPNRGEGDVATATFSSNSVKDTVINFVKTYTTIPIVTVTIATGSAIDYLIKVLSISTTSMTVRLRERTNTAVSDTVFIQWTARAWL